jgi:SPP1 gp7 family putative phage head morphogenesis protein|tara:strand:- start:3803 stop:4615 length:813 start_codon:yes stop_codon:yes gene_type:complete
MIINYSELKRFDKELNTLENKNSKLLSKRYDKLASETKKQIKGLKSGYRKNINLTGRTVKTNLKKEIENNLNQYFGKLENASTKSVRGELAKSTTDKAERLRIANIKPDKSISGNKKWAAKLAEKQVKGFEQDVNKHIKEAIKLNPKITDNDLKKIIDDRLKSFKNVRLEATIKNEANRIQNQVRQEGFEQSGLVRGIVFTAVLDNRTTQNCRDKNGTKLRIDSPMMDDYLVPNHINCRSYHAPILIKDKNVRYTSDSKVKRIADKFKDR